MPQRRHGILLPMSGRLPADCKFAEIDRDACVKFTETPLDDVGFGQRHRGEPTPRCPHRNMQGGTVSSSATVAPLTDAGSAGRAAELPVNVTAIRTEGSDRDPLTFPQRVTILETLRDLAELENNRVEGVAVFGRAAVAAYDIGLRDAVRDALTKLDNGTYGDCETCHHPIPAARLKALPYARRCVTCQRGWENGCDPVSGLVGSVVRELAGEPQGPGRMPLSTTSKYPCAVR